MKKTINISTLPLTVFIGLIVVSAFFLSGCGPSPEKVCIEEASALWDNQSTNKSGNKAYWNAVKLCNEKHS